MLTCFPHCRPTCSHAAPPGLQTLTQVAGSVALGVAAVGVMGALAIDITDAAGVRGASGAGKAAPNVLRAVRTGTAGLQQLWFGGGQALRCADADAGGTLLASLDGSG